MIAVILLQWAATVGIVALVMLLFAGFVRFLWLTRNYKSRG